MITIPKKSKGVHKLEEKSHFERGKNAKEELKKKKKKKNNSTLRKQT